MITVPFWLAIPVALLAFVGLCVVCALLWAVCDARRVSRDLYDACPKHR
jgi:hypothetical protein